MSGDKQPTCGECPDFDICKTLVDAKRRGVNCISVPACPPRIRELAAIERAERAEALQKEAAVGIELAARWMARHQPTDPKEQDIYSITHNQILCARHGNVHYVIEKDGEREVIGKANDQEWAIRLQAERNEMFTECHEAKARAEKAEVQLAGCGVAALGGINEDQRVSPGDYGWSASYGDVVALRERCELLAERLEYTSGLVENSASRKCPNCGSHDVVLIKAGPPEYRWFRCSNCPCEQG